MTFKKMIKYGLCINIFAMSLPLVNAAENLTPIATVEWDEVSSAQGNDALKDQTSMDDSVEETIEEMLTTEAEELPAKTNHSESFQEVKAIIDLIKDTEVQKASDYYLLDMNGESVGVKMFGYVEKEGVGYYTTQEPPFLPETRLIQQEEGVIQKVFTPANQLATYAADAINMYPHVYTGTKIEDFYVYVQENHEKIKDKFITVDQVDENLQTSFDQFLIMDKFIQSVTLSFLEERGDSLAIEEMDNVATILLQEETAQAFTDYFAEQLKAHSDLDPIFQSWIDKGIEGTITVNYDTKEIGLGLLSDQGDQHVKGLEYYIQPVEEDVQMPNSDQIMDQEAFASIVGFDPIQAIKDLNQQIDIQAFTTEEGANAN